MHKYVYFWAIVKANVINYSVRAFKNMSLVEMFLSDPHPYYISWFIKHVISIARVNRYMSIYGNFFLGLECWSHNGSWFDINFIKELIETLPDQEKEKWQRRSKIMCIYYWFRTQSGKTGHTQLMPSEIRFFL